MKYMYLTMIVVLGMSYSSCINRKTETQQKTPPSLGALPTTDESTTSETTTTTTREVTGGNDVPDVQPPSDVKRPRKLSPPTAVTIPKPNPTMAPDEDQRKRVLNPSKEDVDDKGRLNPTPGEPKADQAR